MDIIIALVLLGSTLFAAFAALWSVVTPTTHHITDEEQLSAIKQDHTLAITALRHNWD